MFKYLLVFLKFNMPKTSHELFYAIMSRDFDVIKENKKNLANIILWIYVPMYYSTAVKLLAKTNANQNIRWAEAVLKGTILLRNSNDKKSKRLKNSVNLFKKASSENAIKGKNK